MKINPLPTNKLALLCTAFCAAAMLAFTPNASADAVLGFFPDTHVVGTISPAAPADAADVADYINFMITLSTPGSGTFAGPGHITRTSNVFGSLPMADGSTTGGSVSDDSGGNTIDLNAGGVYLLTCLRSTTAKMIFLKFGTSVA